MGFHQGLALPWWVQRAKPTEADKKLQSKWVVGCFFFLLSLSVNDCCTNKISIKRKKNIQTGGGRGGAESTFVYGRYVKQISDLFGAKQKSVNAG